MDSKSETKQVSSWYSLCHKGIRTTDKSFQNVWSTNLFQTHKHHQATIIKTQIPVT